MRVHLERQVERYIMTEKKVVAFIMEGPSDEAALGSIMKEYFSSNEVQFVVLHGDITLKDYVSDICISAIHGLRGVSSICFLSLFFRLARNLSFPITLSIGPKDRTSISNSVSID